MGRIRYAIAIIGCYDSEEQYDSLNKILKQHHIETIKPDIVRSGAEE